LGAKEKAERLLRPMETIYLATLTADGLPDVRAISAVKSEGLGTIWMVSGADAPKTKELERNPACMIYATEMEDDQDYVELRLWGTVAVLSDAASRDEAWNDVYREYFPGGKDDENMRALKFTASRGWVTTLEGREEMTF